MTVKQIALNRETFAGSAAREACVYFSGAVFLALMSHLSIPLPFTPVPLTMQTFGLLALAAFLGRRSFFCSVLFLAGGSLGLPAFSGGAAGAGLLGPTGGYLLAFPLTAFVTGYISEQRWKNEFVKYAAAMLAGEAVLYACGLAWLGRFTGYGAVLQFGLYPFIAGDIFKLLLAASVVSGASRYRAD
jgi:biotin transport system substrate-specific component